MNFNVYTGNHGKKDGIEDFIKILSDTITRRGHLCTVGETLIPDTVNLIIDEFTNYFENEKLKVFREAHPKTPIVFVLTEFITRCKGIRTFNFFEGWMGAGIIAYLTLLIRTRRNDFHPPRVKDWLVAIAYAPILLGYVTCYMLVNFRRHPLRRLQHRAYHYAYLLMRYLGLQAYIQYADYIMLAHPAIAKGLHYLQVDKIPPNLGVLHPEFDLTAISSVLLKDKRLHIEMTGSITPYRQKFIEIINFKIIMLGMQHVFGSCKVRRFGESSKKEKGGAFSLHPPQTKHWRYCSPTRLYRAIAVDRNIPVITKNFKQHPIEEIPLLIDFKNIFSFIKASMGLYTQPQRVKEFLDERLRRYNDIANAENDKIFFVLQQHNGASHS